MSDSNTFSADWVFRGNKPPPVTWEPGWKGWREAGVPAQMQSSGSLQKLFTQVLQPFSLNGAQRTNPSLLTPSQSPSLPESTHLQMFIVKTMYCMFQALWAEVSVTVTQLLCHTEEATLHKMRKDGPGGVPVKLFTNTGSRPGAASRAAYQLLLQNKIVLKGESQSSHDTKGTYNKKPVIDKLHLGVLEQPVLGSNMGKWIEGY